MQKSLAIITGASSGIGLETAKLLSKNGYYTILISRNEEKLNAIPVSNSIKIPFDLAKLEAYPSLFDQINTYEKKIGLKCGVLVNNCGISGNSLLASMKMDEIHRLISINLQSYILMSQHVSKGMISAREGAIINISSVVGAIIGNSGQTVYGASKAGVVGFTKSLAKELGRKGIRVNSVCPGFIDTKMTRSLTEAKRNDYIKSIPLNRFGSTNEVAETIFYLINAKYITGQSIVIDGGLTC
jgi:NAD(P)-dependent dehydrogenase (short-subunit alcohol dehydrogenase family)